MKPGKRPIPVVRTPWHTSNPDTARFNEDGFSLVELIIVTLILPIIIGAITLALISIFSLQTSTAGRISGSGDAQVVSSNFETDVQDASYITTTTTTTTTTPPAPCETAAQVANVDVVVLGLQMNSANQVTTGLQSGNGQMEVTYLEVPSGTGSSATYSLVRNVCQHGSTTPVGNSTVSHAVPFGQTVSVTCDTSLQTALASGTPAITSLQVTSLPTSVASGDPIKVGTGSSAVTFTANGTPSILSNGLTSIPVASQTLSTSQSQSVGASVVDQTWATSNCGANAGWIGTANVTGVTFATTGPASHPYAFQVSAVPRPGSTSTQPSTVSSPNSNCVFATGSGTYTTSLCFVDLSGWNSYSGTSSASCTAAGVSGLAMTSSINRTADLLSFCLNVSSVATSTGTAVSGAISGGGYNGVAAVPFPTYPGAFLGNNGFYTVTNSQKPALYQQNTNVGKTTTVTISNIQVTDPSGHAATGWELVTGDAETTDTSESITWSTTGASAPNLQLLPNTPTSPVGNACESAPPTTNTTYLTGLGTTTVKCSATDSSTKTGTVMLEAPSPTGLTVTMVGTGLEGMFIGVMLPYTTS